VLNLDTLPGQSVPVSLQDVGFIRKAEVILLSSLNSSSGGLRLPSMANMPRTVRASRAPAP